MSFDLKNFLFGFITALILLVGGFSFMNLIQLHQNGTSTVPSNAIALTNASLAAALAANPASLVITGKALFAENCASCHGTDGVGANGPNLHKNIRSPLQLAEVIYYGPGGRSMPAFSSQLQKPQIAAIAEYVHTLK